MKSLNFDEKCAIISILTQIMAADGIIHPYEEKFMDNVYATLGIKISDMEKVANFDEIQAKTIIEEFSEEQKQFSKHLFMSMAQVDGCLHPSELLLINQFL